MATGVLKVRVGGVWQEVTSSQQVMAGGVAPSIDFGQPPADGTASSFSRSDHYHGLPNAPSEVIVSDTEPTDPDAELWFNPTGIPPATGNVPPGGVTGNPLTKLSDVDQHVGWGTGDVVLNEDGKGYLTLDGGGLVKRVGGGIALKKQSTNLHPVVMNYDGSAATNIITADGVASMTGPLAFTTALGKKLKLYAETFGFGIESGTLVAYVPAANKFAVRQDSTTGTEWFAVNNTAAYYKNSVLLTQTAGDARYSRVVGGWVTVTKNSGISGNIRYRIAPGSGICSLEWTLGTPGSADICTLPAEARPAYRVAARSSHGTDHYYSDVTIYSDGRVHTQGGTDGLVEGSVSYPVG